MFLKTITAMAIDSSKEEVKDEQQHSVTTHPKPTPTENQVTTLNINIQTQGCQVAVATATLLKCGRIKS